MTNAMPSLGLFKATSRVLYVSLIVLAILIQMPNTNALKHSFIANHDARFFIGPIGLPYGFLKEGIYSLRISQFRINTSSNGGAGNGRKSKHGQSNSMTDKDIIREMDGLHPGFLLKRFDNEAEFATFEETIIEDPTRCGFGGMEHEIDEHSFEDQNYGNIRSLLDADSNADSDVDAGVDTDTAIPIPIHVVDDHVATGPGVFDGGPDGIFISMKHPKQWKPNEPTVHHKFTVQEEGYYFLFYQICLSESTKNEKYLFKEVRSSFKLDFEYRNYDLMGKISFLTAGEMLLPHMYLYFSVSYALLLFLWVRRLSGEGFGGGFGGGFGMARKPTVYAIHHLMSSVLLLKVLSIFFESVRYHYIRVNGHAELWSIVYYGLNFVKGTFLFTVILLIGSGWSFFKPFLTPKERRVIYLVFILQIVDNVAILMLTHETMGERLYNDWSAVLHLVDIISCCAILVPIVWQVNSLEQSIETAESGDDGAGKDDDNANADADGGAGAGETGETVRLQSKLNLFRSFYLIVVAYIYFTRIVVYLFASTLSYNHTWMKYFLTEVGTLLFYVVIGVKFMPTAESEYEQVNNEYVPKGSNEITIELGEMS